MRLRRKKDEPSETAVAAAPDPDDAAATSEPPRQETPRSVDTSSNNADAHPEVMVGAAFVGGLALAQIVKRFGK